MKIDIYVFVQEIEQDELVHDINPTHLGYVEVEDFNPQEIWNLCNWTDWTEEKPSNLYTDTDINTSCSHGLYITDPETGEGWLSLSNGWLVGDEDKIFNYVLENRCEILWI